MKRVLLGLLALGLSSPLGCGDENFQVLLRVQTQEAVSYTCPDGQVVSFPLQEPVAGEPKVAVGLAQAEACLGINLTTCPEAGLQPAGAAACADVATNAFAGTCVAAFFDCYQPVGECTQASEGHLTYASGDNTYADDNPRKGGDLGRMVPVGSSACISWEQFDDRDANDGLIFIRE